MFVSVCVISVSIYSLSPPSDLTRLLGGWPGPGTWILSQLEIATQVQLATLLVSLITAILRHGDTDIMIHRAWHIQSAEASLGPDQEL